MFEEDSDQAKESNDNFEVPLDITQELGLSTKKSESIFIM